MTGKIAVMGLLERHGKDGRAAVRTAGRHEPQEEHTCKPTSRDTSQPGADVYTDALASYDGLR